jgi:hypothetical protein
MRVNGYTYEMGTCSRERIRGGRDFARRGSGGGLELGKHGTEYHESSLRVNVFLGYHSNGEGKSLERGIPSARGLAQDDHAHRMVRYERKERSGDLDGKRGEGLLRLLVERFFKPTRSHFEAQCKQEVSRPQNQPAAPCLRAVVGVARLNCGCTRARFDNRESR